MYNEGISKSGDLLDLATQLEVVDKRGAYYSYGDIRLGQGRENAKEFLRENPDLADELELTIRQHTVETGLLSADEEFEVLEEEG